MPLRATPPLEDPDAKAGGCSNRSSVAGDPSVMRWREHLSGPLWHLAHSGAVMAGWGTGPGWLEVAWWRSSPASGRSERSGAAVGRASVILLGELAVASVEAGLSAGWRDRREAIEQAHEPACDVRRERR